MNAVIKAEADFVPTVQPYRELMLGAGSSRDRKVFAEKAGKTPFKCLTTVDVDPVHNPDILHDLNVTPWPIESNAFDEVHAYEVLEHLGQQGDAASFFAHFSEIWRVLKPEGRLYASTPAWDSPWAWGDPGHKRLICKESLIFLIQENYEQVGKTPMTDYRHIYKANFDIEAIQELPDMFAFILRARK